MMKRVLITTCLLAIVSIGLATVAHAVQEEDRPFFRVTPNKHSLDLGKATSPGFFSIENALTLKVESNCLHGPIKVSVSNLKRKMGGNIPPERIYIRSKETMGFVSMKNPVAVSKPQVGSHNIVLDMQVQTGYEDIAGDYKGTFTVTIMPPV